MTTMIQLPRVLCGIWLATVALGCSAQAPPAQRPTNRLAKEVSPYLQQHKHNPVDWYPWGEEAFARARSEGKPIFLSVGYAACHWCHVMERESFESEETARLLNESFISIKVDREERPDVDDVYMSVVQMIAGRGGWPMTVFMTADQKPFFGGTYFRPDAFRNLLSRVAKVWKDDRKEIEHSADQLTEALRRQMRTLAATARMPQKTAAADLVADLRSSFDKLHGGFSAAPKFPPHNTLPLLLSTYARTKDPSIISMVKKTLDAMAAGGIRDHLGGGFHRYSTDERWLVPHFEKMLYDNALLARAFAEAYVVTKKPLYAEVCRETLDWVLREMRGPEGGFYSSLDADSEGKEGVYYVWRREEILKLLGPQDGPRFSALYGVEEAGNFKVESTGQQTGDNILHLKSPDANSTGMGTDRWRATLLAEREKRVRPALDDKRLTSWNALMVGSLARCGTLLQEPRYTSAARTGAEFVLSKLRKDGSLLRRYRPAPEAQAKDIPGFLEDYAYLADALLDLYEATKESRWKDEAAGTVEKMVALFADPQGGFFDTPLGHETLIVRAKSGYDGALPSPNAVGARALFRLAALTGRKDLRDRAVGTIKTFGEIAERSPRAVQTLIYAHSAYIAGTQAVASSAQGAQSVQRGPVKVQAMLGGKTGQNRAIVVTLTLESGWHLNSDRPLDRSLIPTRVTVSGPGARFAGPRYPAAKRVKLGFSPEQLSVFTGTTKITVPVLSSTPGTVAEVRIRFQACDDRACLQPESVTLRITIP
jgi:uncharacterized protein